MVASQKTVCILDEDFGEAVPVHIGDGNGIPAVNEHSLGGDCVFVL